MCSLRKDAAHDDQAHERGLVRSAMMLIAKNLVRIVVGVVLGVGRPSSAVNRGSRRVAADRARMATRLVRADQMPSDVAGSSGCPAQERARSEEVAAYCHAIWWMRRDEIAALPSVVMVVRR